MCSMQEKQARLKETVIKYLETCEDKKCLLANLWNNVSQFQKKSVSHKLYGVTKMHILLDKFSDVIVCSGKFVYLRDRVSYQRGDSDQRGDRGVSYQQGDSDQRGDRGVSYQRGDSDHRGERVSYQRGDSDQSSIIMIDSDSDSDEEEPASSATGWSSTGQAHSWPQQQFQEQVISILLAHNGKCSVRMFMDKYQAAYGPVPADWNRQLLAKPAFFELNNNQLVLQQGAYSHRKTTPSLAVSGHQQTRPRSAMSDPPVWGAAVTNKSSPQQHNASISSNQPSTSAQTHDFIPFSAATQQHTGIAATATAIPAYQRYGLSAQSLLPTPASSHTFQSPAAPGGRGMMMMNQLRPGTFLSPGQTAFQSLGNFSLIPGQVPTSLSAFASPSLVSPAVPEIEISEWPRSNIKSGPPPGTKVIHDVKEIIVKPIFLARGTRLSSEQVSCQVQECIDAISQSQEHVSIERVESMLIRKFQVPNFRSLNLREVHMELLDAAREHSMKLGKVNVYIQNFVRSRSMCTLYELKLCLREFHPDSDEFESLKLGPLQKMPLVYDTFKFPMDEYIPELTILDLLECLHSYLDRTQKWTQKVKLEDFMNYLMEQNRVSSALSLGIRIRSLPLAIQMLKKSQRDAAASRKKCREELIQLLTVDLHDAFTKFRSSILQSSHEGSLELRRHYMNLSPEDTVRDILTKFEFLAHILTSNTPHSNKMDKMMKHFRHFLKSVLEVPIPRMLYHLSVCLSDLQVQQSAQELFEQEAKQHEQQTAAIRQVEAGLIPQERVPPTKVGLIEKVLIYLNRCMERGSLQLAHLGRIETKLLEDFSFSSFADMGYGRFLEFLLAQPKIKTILEECGGTFVGVSSGSQETVPAYKTSHLELLQFICQCRHAGVTQSEQLEQAICEQFLVQDVRRLGHSNMARLMSAADRPGKHVSQEYHVSFEAALCGKSPTPRGTSKVGILGCQSRESAMACLTACPVLEDMMEWSHWSLVFEPQLGCLRDFIEKHGGLQEIQLGNHQTATSDFMALEVEPGRLLKVTSQASVEQFIGAVGRQDPRACAGCLVSLIVANRGLEGASLPLLAIHLKACLVALHAQSLGASTPGEAPDCGSLYPAVDLAVQFVTDVILHLPVRICVAVANQLLLEPLSSVVGSAKSKKEIMKAAKLPAQRQRLELLGCLIGLPEWTTLLQAKWEFPASHVTQVLEDKMLVEIESDTDLDLQEEEEEAEREDESGSLESDMDSILSSDEDGASSSCHLDEKTETFQEISGTEKDDGNMEANVNDPRLEKSGQVIMEGGGAAATEISDTRSESSNESCLSLEELPASEELKSQTQPQQQQQLHQTREEICQHIVSCIQTEEFGVGIQLDDTGERLMRKQQERQGRSLQRLSKDLYSKETHFVLELIQNADDNSYSTHTLPAVQFLIDFSGVTVLNNETGFEEVNVRALCDVGKSTKHKHMLGYIGQKGIGFKSVFRVTSRPEIHSNGFHICFDVDSGPMGYILPHWISNSTAQDSRWQTRIILPWTEDIKKNVHTHAARFNDIQPSLLLFLHRLKEITIENKVEGTTMFMQRVDVSEKEVQISHTYGTDRWIVLRKILDASGVSLQMKSGVEIESTEIALAFPIQDTLATSNTQTKLKKLPVFAFLPLRSYGFRFIIQGDFDVPSSREDVDRDSSWNQWIRNHIHVLFVEALDVFKARPDMSSIKALLLYLQFVPLEGEVMDFFKPVATKILALLRARECMPALSVDSQCMEWKLPSKTLISRDSLVREVISSELLNCVLGLHYLHPDVAASLNDPLIHALGVESITTEHLLHIGQFIAVNWDDGASQEQVPELAKWLACVYRSLDDFQDHTQTVTKLCNMKVVPLSDGRLVSLSDVTVFLLSNSRPAAAAAAAHVDTATTHRKKNTRDPLFELKKDLNLVDAELTSTSDSEVNSQVVKLLLRLGVKQMTAHEVIHSHILPVFKSDQWKEKSRDVIVCYLVYVKTEREHNMSIVDLSELRSAVRLVTNHGIKCAHTDDVHFSPAFGNKIDLCRTFPGYDWTFVDSSYLPPSANRAEAESWHKFLSELGVVDFLRIRRTEIHFDKTSIHETAWACYGDVWPDSPDGFTVADFQCEEFHKLVTANQKPKHHYKQMTALYELLDVEWSGKYSSCVTTQLKSGSGHVLKDIIQTSFSIYLESLQWVPCLWKTVTVKEDKKTPQICLMNDLRKPSELYIQDKNIQNLLAHTVKYLDVQVQGNSSFTKFLKIKTLIDASQLKEALISWSHRDETSPDTPSIFCTTKRHILQLYEYLTDYLSSKDVQDLFHKHPVIFVPILSPDETTEEGDMLAGQMLRREEVWWSDSSMLFTKHRNSLHVYKSPLAKYHFLQHLYHSLESKLVLVARVEREPSTFHLAQLLKHIATVNSASDTSILADVLLLFSRIGADLHKITEIIGGVKTLEASLAESNQPKVLELLTKAAVFPTKQGQWVSLSDHPMIADSLELEDMFQTKPGVYFLQLEAVNEYKRGTRHVIDQVALKYCMSLFEDIRLLSDCVKTEEITTHFKQCSKGQQFLHDVIAFVQRFLYFSFPHIHQMVKEKKADTLKELLFSQVGRLEVRYELIGRPDVYEIREEKCVLKDKHFYFHERYINSQTDIIKEVAKYFSEGNEDCFRELRNFLTQVVPILEGTSDETIEGLLSRQKTPIAALPSDEQVWEIPPPIIEVAPEPPKLDESAQTMVYGRTLSVPGGVETAATQDDDGIKSWPPRSALFKEKTKKSGDQQPGIWPPSDQGPSYAISSKQLPSNIKFEKDEPYKSEDGNEGGKDKKLLKSGSSKCLPGESSGEAKLSSDSAGRARRHSFQSAQDQHAAGRPVTDEADNSTTRKVSAPTHAHTCHRQSSLVDEDTATYSPNTGKRKMPDTPREEDKNVAKRHNSQETEQQLTTEMPEDEVSKNVPSSSAVNLSQTGVTQKGLDDSDHVRDTRASESNLSQEVTPSCPISDHDVRRTNKKGFLHFNIPLWSENFEDVAYTELSKGQELSIPPIVVNEESPPAEIGDWGEKLVWDYLLQQQQRDNSRIQRIIWANAGGEQGLPYDFQVHYNCNQEEEENIQTVYIEVKSTLSWDKEIFPVSSKQVEFALELGECYEIYRVFGAGNHRAKLVRVENVAERMRTKSVRLFMLI